MEEVRQLVQEEGREARNLVAFHVAVDTPSAAPRFARKPPRSTLPPPRRAPPRPAAARLRSASAGRDKRSELRARYWALLFGDLQRAVGEIYNTVEAHENLNECQEVILVLENYTRDFKSLGEWFRLKWEYDNTPPPQRPQSLAWEIRKTDFVRPESRRAHSVKSSPSVSGKNSPCLSGHNTPSGKNSPNLTGKASPGSGKISPRVSSGHATSPKANLEFFSNKIAASKVTTKPEPKQETKLTEIKEKDINNGEENAEKQLPVLQVADEKIEKLELPIVEIGKAKQYSNATPKPVVVKSSKNSSNKNKMAIDNTKKIPTEELSTQAKATQATLNAMENVFLDNQLLNNKIKNENMINKDIELEKEIAERDIEKKYSDIGEKGVGNDASTNSAIISEPTLVSCGKVTKQTHTETRIIEKSLQEPDPESKAATDTVTDMPNESPTKSEDNFADISNESSSKSIEDKHDKLDEPHVMANTKEHVIVSTSQTENNTATAQEDNVSHVTDKHVVENKPPNNEVSKESIDVKVAAKNKDEFKDDRDFKKPEPKVDTKTCVKPAYSQAAAKPKAPSAKIEVKTLTRSMPLTRSKTVVDIRPNTTSKTQKVCPKRNQTSKCSYPFNLTTGRTIFDTSNVVNKSTVPRKVISKNVQMGSGDSKSNQPKVEVKKRLVRPTSLKANEELDKKEKANFALEKIKDCDEYSSSDTIVTQIDMCRLESSESLRTLVPDDLELIHDAANSVEVLNIDGNKNDNDGWRTVKSRRLSRESKKQSKSHWVNRFHQPSATTSLPTLNMIESPKLEVKPIVNAPVASKADRAKSEQPKVVKPEKNVTVSSKSRVDTRTRNLAIIRQKSDVTGLKRSARNKALSKKAEKIKDTHKNPESSELTKNRLHSSLESLTTGLARSQESTEEVFDFDKWKAEFRSTFKYLEDDDQMPNHNEILKSADPSEMSEIAAMTSQIEENEKKISWALDFQSEVDQRKLCEEEDLLNRQIMELQQVSDIDLDTETDDTETDAEILCEDVPDLTGAPENLGSLAASLEDQYETALAGMSWAERVDTLVVLEALVARDPGRAQQLHAKLSQGIKRRGSFQDALRRLQAKQARAERQRLEYQTERAKKIHQLLARVEEVKVAKNQLIEEKRLRMERRLQKATENRDQHLKDIVRKAHDEEEKLREIAFIKQLEAENRRHEFLDQCRTHTTRLRRVRRDRLNKLEQKAAREAAVGARRQALEAERQRHVQTLLERRRERDRRVDGLREMRRQERDIAAREKAEGVKSRLSALAAAAELEADALRSRIRDKQDASQQRLESHLQAIREKATGPRQPTTSESQDNDLDEAVRIEQERKERDKVKALKKKARKVKQKLLVNGNENSDSEQRIPIDAFLYPAFNKMYKVVQQINNILSPLVVEQKPAQTGENDEQKTARQDLTKVNGEVPDQETENNKAGKVNGDISAEEIKDKPEVEMNGNVDAKELEKKKSKKKKNSDKRDASESNNNNNINTEITDVKESKKNKKKKKDDKAKLKKTESICSSLSDMSKASDKSERRNKVSLDSLHLERSLNELHRMMEKSDKQAPDKTVFKKLHGMKTLEQLLALAAEREDLTNQITTKCLSTAVTISSRGFANDQEGARCLLNSNASVYVVKLLANQMEKDLSDPREAELTCLLLDWLSVALDSVTHGVAPPATWARAHLLVSYICLSGVARADTVEEVRDGLHTLITVCCVLCRLRQDDPDNINNSPERLAAAQSLHVALGRGLCGARADFCALFASGVEVAAREFVRAARTGHLLRIIAELDHQLVQESFMEGGWALEFRAAVARLLNQHAPSEKEAPRANSCVQLPKLDEKLAENMVMDLIVLVGYVVVNNPQLQETICDGWSVVKQLCTLPANWLVSAEHSSALLPTLAALAAHPPAAAHIRADLSLEMLQNYLESEDAQKVKLVRLIKQGRPKKTPGKK